MNDPEIEKIIIMNNNELRELDTLLSEISGIFDGWHSDGTNWTEFDQSIRVKINIFRKKHTYTPAKWEQETSKTPLSVLKDKIRQNPCSEDEIFINTISVNKWVKTKDRKPTKPGMYKVKVCYSDAPGHLAEMKMYLHWFNKKLRWQYESEDDGYFLVIEYLEQLE